MLKYLYDGSGIIGMVYDGTSYYFHRNIQGDVVGVYNSAGTKVVGFTYDAYGNCTVSGDTSLAYRCKIRYRGYYFDTETGLYWVQTRYYNPQWCRWISPDTLDYLDPETAHGLNLYAYCGNDPVNFIDPSGHLAFFILTAIIGAAIGVGITAAVDYADNKQFDLHWGWYLGAGLLGALIGAGIGMAVSYYATGSVLSSTSKVFSGLFGKTTYYRTMSEDEFAYLKTSKNLRAGAETFISPSSSYASSYNGLTVELTVRNRTINWLTKIGVRDGSALVGSVYPSMPLVSKGWMATNAYFKAELGLINIGLGYGRALDIFNKGLIMFSLL